MWWRAVEHQDESALRSPSQPEELLRGLGCVVAVGRGCAGDVGVRTGDVGRALQEPSRRPGQEQGVSCLRKIHWCPGQFIRDDFAAAEYFGRVKVRRNLEEDLPQLGWRES